MGFSEVLKRYWPADLAGFFGSITPGQVNAVINKQSGLSEEDFLTILSPVAENSLEAMAQKAHALTVMNFGRVIFLYTPMYLSNHCNNECVYCGFNTGNRLNRKTLTIAEVEEEGRIIAATGLRHLLILTGESPAKAPVDYIAACVERLRRHFSSISIEIYPLKTGDYRTLVESGVDGLTIYQEVYDPEVYDAVHIRGPKKDYLFRLDAPERACLAGMRTVNLGALLGLADWRSEVLALGMHAKYLQDKYPGTEISVSFPRMRPAPGAFRPEHPVSDIELVRMITAFRIFLPRAGITISTRERAEFRDRIIRLGVTKMSAGSSTEVGGRIYGEGHDSQFEISDPRTVGEMKEAILNLGYQPVCKDWLVI